MGEEQSAIKLSEKRKMWKIEAEKALKNNTIESLTKMSYEGIGIKPLYDEIDTEASQSGSIRKESEINQWKICQAISANKPKEINERIKAAKERGQDSFYLTFTDNIANREDLSIAYSSLEWDKDSIFVDVGENIGFIPFFFYDQKMNHNFKEVTGTIGFDPYEQLLVKGKNDISLTTKLDFLADTIKWSYKNKGTLRSLIIKGNIYNEAGANALQELVFTFAHTLELINELLDRGLSIDQIANSITLSFGVGSSFFMEIAKLRAARDLWASLIHALGGNEQDHKLHLHAITTTFNKTAFDIHVNLLRTTTEGLSAVIAGVDELTILPFDSVLNQSSKLAERIARNTHFILKEESLMSRVIDPSAGSYYVETLTEQLATEAWVKIKQLDEEGGFLHQLLQGNIQSELNIMEEKRREDVNTRKTFMIGTNVFANPNETVTVRTYDTNVKTNPSGMDRVVSFQEAIKYIEKEKRVPKVNNGLQKEKCQATPIHRHRLIEHFEQLRLQAEKAKSQGLAVKVGVIPLGKLKDYKPSFDFISGILSAGGVEVDLVSYNETNFLSGLKAVIFCGKSKDLDVINSDYIQQVKLKNPLLKIYTMGRGQEETVEKHQLDGEITTNMNVYHFLENMHSILGVERA